MAQHKRPKPRPKYRFVVYLAALVAIVGLSARVSTRISPVPYTPIIVATPSPSAIEPTPSHQAGGTGNLSVMIPPHSVPPTPSTQVITSNAIVVKSAQPQVPMIYIGGWSNSIVIDHISQSAIDSCGSAVGWYGNLPPSGTLWLAGHNYCGFAFWAKLPLGTIVKIVDSRGTFMYSVVSRTYLNRHGGAMNPLLIHGDLILQTCYSAGTEFTYANLIG